MTTILTRPNNANVGGLYIVADKYKTNTDEKLKTCKRYSHNLVSNIPLDDLIKMREELVHVKAYLNESQSSFKNQIKKIDELVGISNQNQVASNTTHLSISIYTPSANSSNTNTNTNSNNQKHTTNTSISTNVPSINQKSKPEINTKVIPTKNSDQTQKMSSRIDRSLNPSPKVRNERSTRSIDRNIVLTSGNALDIWIRSSPLFQRLPTNQDMDEICQAIDTDSTIFSNQSKQHWSDGLCEIVKNSQKESKKSKNNQILMPPGKPPAPNDISEYWAKRTPPFQIEDIQKQNKSIMHCLLSAFVEAKPLPKSQESDDLSNSDFLPIHVLLPQLDFDDYMSYPFEERLELELKSAGLERPKEGMNTVNNAFAKEIEEYKKDIRKLQPQIDELHDEIIQNLPKYRLDENRRMTEASEYSELLAECRKDHKKA